jgi:hypothetical protein
MRDTYKRVSVEPGRYRGLQKGGTISVPSVQKPTFRIASAAPTAADAKKSSQCGGLAKGRLI